MSTKTASHFIHVSTDPDSWGANVYGFNCIAEARRIRDAAESAGVAVAFDADRRTVKYNNDGSERSEIDWFSPWCGSGYAWKDEHWVEWFSKFSK